MAPIPGFGDLLARARAGDPAATEELLARVRPWLTQLARQHADPRQADASASDLVQEAWLRAWQKLDQFQGAADEAQALAMFRAWLARIVTRVGLNSMRDGDAQRRRPPGKLLRLDVHRADAAGDAAAALDPSAAGPTPSAGAQADEQSRLVHEALDRLTDPLGRDIVRLRFFEGLSLRQAAERLGLNHETARQRYHAALGRLQQDLDELA
jgi:RNA polymerase sigma-70 factor (ECF subfamily)